MPARLDSPVRQASLREHNLALVLRHVAEATRRLRREPGGPIGSDGPDGSRPVSRADVAAATGLTRATVSTLVDELVAGRLVAEVDPAPRNGAGRPATGLVLFAGGAAGLGLEINVDYLAACVVDLTGAIRHRAVRAGDLRRRSPERVFAELATLAEAARGAAVAEDLTVAGAALAVPGLVEHERLIRLAPNLGWRDVDAVAALSRRPGTEGAGFTGGTGFTSGMGFTSGTGFTGGAGSTGRARFTVDAAFTVDNEANLAALGELRSQPPEARASFLYISGEIGVGAGIVLDGELFRGGRGWSGELGHVTVDPDGPPCRCGARGCLEQYAGQEAILRAAGHPAGGSRSRNSEVKRIVGLAEAGDPAMLESLAAAGRALGVTVAGVVNLLDIDTVVLGGSYAPLSPWLREPVTREIRTRVVTSDWAPVTVRPSALGSDAAVVGAAGSVIRSVLDHPARWLAP